MTLSRRTLVLILGVVVVFAIAAILGVGQSPPTEARTGDSAASPDVRTAAVIVLLGFIVFVLGQVAQRFFIEPVQEQRKVIGEIAYAVVYYANVSARLSTEERKQETMQTLRRLSAQLRSTLWTIRPYPVFESLGWAEQRDNILTASTGLIGWSNSVLMKDDSATWRHRRAVIGALRLPEET